jgi:hypothetical protein
MTERRTMGEMLTEVADGALSAASHAGLRATRVEVTLPVEVAFKGRELLADVPRLVTRCDFDPILSRLTVVWQEALA